MIIKYQSESVINSTPDKKLKYKFNIMIYMGKISASDAFDILNKNNKENILKNFGMDGLGKIKDHFLDAVATTVDINDESVKEIYWKTLNLYSGNILFKT